ncbi:hypothetical protein MA16_Dca028739 [Dendrobium catenatum]|uniref:Uncharacterized protein n=1 Tax=Dendrobium catenatum TaxID=906689 RepID=A0A2I0V8S4_9ASPA|nr:hypothetical protein MA16_Dca028739 [Dendrobium catenatum]
MVGEPPVKTPAVQTAGTPSVKKTAGNDFWRRFFRRFENHRKAAGFLHNRRKASVSRRQKSPVLSDFPVVAGILHSLKVAEYCWKEQAGDCWKDLADCCKLSRFTGRMAVGAE